jgi:hypothetical protein
LFRAPEQRASDADRDTAVDILCAAAADGRLTLAELDERAGAALSARTIPGSPPSGTSANIFPATLQTATPSPNG